MARVDPDYNFGQRVGGYIAAGDKEGVSRDLSRLYDQVSESMRPIGAWASYQGAAFPIPNAALTIFGMNTYHYDVGGFFSTGFGSPIIPPGLAGLYVVQIGLRYDVDACPAINFIAVRHNGNMMNRVTMPVGVFSSGTATFPVYCNVGDVVEFVAYQDSGAAINLDAVAPSATEAASPQIRLFLTS